MAELHDPKFYDEADLDREMRRVFDVCHTCRMCFSYCPSFPSLFEAIDRHEERGEGEVDALTAEEIVPVVDLCWQCRLCYVKCPYTPPHKFAVDFPRLLMRAKIVKARRNGVPLRERVLGDPDRLGRLSTGFLSGFVNWANRNPVLRRGLQAALGVHRRRTLPPFARKRFGFRETKAADVVLFATCSVDYNYPQVARAAMQVLEHNGKSVTVPKVGCCGLPALDGGDVDTAVERIRRDVEVLLPLVRAGMPVIVLAPSCGLMMKDEWPRLLPTDAVREVAAATVDIGEYLAGEKAAGRLRLDFTNPQGSIAYHVPCHLRAQNIGQPFRAILGAVPETRVEAIEQCSAFDGTWGMKREYYETSRKCAGKLCGALREANASRMMSDCMLAGLNVLEDLGTAPAHPIEILRDAYGLPPA